MRDLARGVYGILLTTYTENDEVHHQDLASQADFVSATAQGIVWPVLASEFYLMSDEERAAGYEVVAAGNRGRVPFVAGVSATTTNGCVRLAEAAAQAGADAVICMAPYMKKAASPELLRFFKAIAAVGLPIVVQNAAFLTGACTLSPTDLNSLADQVPLIRYLKEEAPVLPHTITNVLRQTEGRFRLVWGGGGGRFMIDELERGAAGCMPACEWADVLGHAFELWERGEKAEARVVHAATLIGNAVEVGYGMDGAIEVLKRRGIVRSTRNRYSNPVSMDADAIRQIEATIELLLPYARWGGTPLELGGRGLIARPVESGRKPRRWTG